MPPLNWIGKEAVEHHHKEVPYRLVHCDGALSAGDPDAGNLLVHGDNLEALKAQLPYYGGQVKCIYIDPPYNTGNEGWVYNDNVNSPEIRSWLGKAVGKEAEDLSRHDKWLCMMYPRGRCCRTLTTEDSHRESMRLDGLHEQAITRPLPHDELVQLHRLAEEAWLFADLAGQGDDLACAA